MLPSAARLKRKSDFGRVYGKGRSYVTDLIVVYVLPLRENAVRVGFSVSKKLGNAVVRNRTKRLLREAVRQYLPFVDGRYHIVIVARRKAAGASLDSLISAVGRLFEKSGVVSETREYSGGPAAY